MNTLKRGKRIRVFSLLFLGIIRDFYKESRLAKRVGLSKARKRMSKRHRKRAIQYRRKALEMGGVLIKLGQFLSSRVDVMPEEYIEELEKLQDMVPAAPFSEVEKIIESEFKKPLNEVFTNFSKKPEAAASLAQVYKATLADSRPVAVKVQRPGIEKSVNFDLATFAYLMEGVKRFSSFNKKVDIEKLVAEFARTLGDELDFFREGHNAVQFKKNFADDNDIYIPKIYFSHTTSRVLTLERVNGIKINDYKTLEKRGISRKEVAAKVVDSYLKQVLEHGFFHADPHPGNLFVLEGPEIIFVDFGMVGVISAQMKKNLREVVIGIAQRNIDKIIEGFIALGFLKKKGNLTPVKKAIAWMIDNYSRLTSNTLTFEDVEEINEDLKKIMRDQPFTIPTEYAFLGRALGTLHGLATGLYPDFNAIDSFSPYVKQIIESEKEALPQIVSSTVTDLLKTLISLPHKIEDVLDALKQQNLSVNVKSGDIVKAIERSTKIQLIASFSIAEILLIMTSFLLLYLNFKIEAYAGFVVSFSVFVYLTIKGVRKTQ